MSSRTSDDGRKGVQSVEHGARVLKALIAARGAVPLKTVASLSQMSASSAHRYLTSLARAELVRQEPVSGHYDLGPLAIKLGLAALDRIDYVERADEALHNLTQRLKIDGHISIWGDHGPTIIRIRQAHLPILTNLRLGRTLPLMGSASGRIFLAHMPEALTSPTLAQETGPAGASGVASAKVKAVIDEVRSAGFAAIDGSVVPGLRAIAAPIFDLQGDLRACMALVSPSQALVDVASPAITALVEAARSTSEALGWRG
jgi:DNA-binding IclR family transcriptional regulator